MSSSVAAATAATLQEMNPFCNVEVVAGDGNLDLKALITELNSQNFEGVCSIEYENDPDDPTAGVMKGLENVANAVKAVG